ncbi:acetoacetate decarboxylase family protein [Amycolatopsis japonica]
MRFEQGKRYRMPVVFGPSVSPRQMPNGLPADMTDARVVTAGVRFLTDAECLDRLLPPGFTLAGEPVVSVEFMFLSNLEWLAGRGYSIVKVSYPAHFAGKRDSATGPFLAVLWENRTDCCLTGREEVGYSKLYADIFPPAVDKGQHRYLAAVDGHPIVRMRISDLIGKEPPAVEANDGVLHYYYVPKIGSPGESAVEHAVISPEVPGPPRIRDFSSGTGEVEFSPATFEQLPTQFMIVNALADLPQLEPRGAYVIEAEGGRTYVDQRALY